MIPKETVDQILDAARIEEVVGDFVALKRRGSSFVSCCPFHNEKTPSFHVTPSRGIYKCFGCGKAGSAIGFLMDYERLSYPEALRYLAKKYNIEIKEEEETAEQMAARQRSESLMAVSEYAGKFFKDQLKTQEGRTIGYQYFRSRGLLDETIDKWGLGWAPKSKEEFTKAALAAGYKEEYLLETGLCSKWEKDGSLHDRFYERVIFPVHSVSGRVIAFGGRILLSTKTENLAKYVNSKESEIYVKSRSLYGIYFAKTEISRKDRCYLMEGYLDVLSMHQAGITNCVASSGTSLTEEQIRIIRKFTENITIMYDGDSAGLHAAIRAIGMILKEGMNPRVVFLPDGDDPDSFSRKHTLEEIQEFIAAHEQDGIVFKTDLLLSEAGSDPLKKASLINEIADTVAVIPDAIKRQVYVDTVAEKFGIDTDIILQRVRRTREEQARETRRERVVREEPAPPIEPLADTPTLKENTQLRKEDITDGSERELLRFIIRSGREPLNFEADSEFHNPDGAPCVAEFIDEALAQDNDGNILVNPAYNALYNAYFILFDQGLSQEDILRKLLNGEDRTMAALVADLSTEKYELTVHNLSDSLTTHESWLVTYVPRAILAYHGKRLALNRNALVKQLEGANAQGMEEIMGKIGRIDAMTKTINNKLGRK